MKKIIYLFLSLLVYKYNIAQTPTWAKDIAPILYAKCTSCHHAGGLAHFPLISYLDTYTKDFLIATQVSNRKMPPWQPDANYSHFVQENVLTQDEIDAINNWITYGRIQGDMAQAPSQPVYSNTSQLGTVDVSLQMPAYTVGGTGDQHRNFPIPSNLLQDVYVTAVEVIPGNPQIVHHVIVYQDTTRAPYLLDSLDAEVGYETVGLNSTARMIMAYTPGNRAYFPPVGTGVKLFRNTTYVIQVHYPAGSQGQIDSTHVNIKFTTVPQREITMWVLPGQKNMVNGPIHIPPNQLATYHERDTIDAPLTLLGVMPHMHLLGRSMKNWAFSPVTNDTIPLINIPDWKFTSQGNYFFTNTVKLETGTILEAEANYDNTANNIYNPNSPPQLVVEGPGTADEMMCVVASYMPYKIGDENIITDRKLIAQGATTICPGHPVVLKTIEGNNYTYQWYKNGFTVAGVTSSFYPATEAGNYHVQIMLGSNTTYTDTIAVAVGSSPSVHVTASGSTVLCEGASVTLTTDTNSTYQYQWYDGIAPLTGETSSSLITDKAGSYTVQVYSGCYAVSAPVDFTTAICSGVESVSANSITVSPNPSSGFFEINGNGYSSSGMHLKMYDLQGRMVYEQNLTSQKQTISLTEVTAGYYLLELAGSRGIVYKKLIVENK